ncbi:hypothetical protein [Streptomyces sp. NPDC047718]|uniref:hypothetical protein n=1 Tax=Streptomyces sp. NPDC047718 TaxID=3155479 RepID=UPI0033EE70C6
MAISTRPPYGSGAVYHQPQGVASTSEVCSGSASVREPSAGAARIPATAVNRSERAGSAPRRRASRAGRPVASTR